MSEPQPDPISLAAVNLDLGFNGQRLQVTGTGFFITVRTGVVLVTAKHNLTGRELNGKCKHTQGALPNELTLSGYRGRIVKSYPLYTGGNDPSSDHPRFHVHNDPEVDVAVMEIGGTALEAQVDPLSPPAWHPLFKDIRPIQLRVAMECHVIGYPEGVTNRLANDCVLPIWKTGHIANDPQFDYGGKPRCLIDATTRPGMSGAPVFVIDDHAVRDEWLNAAGVVTAFHARGQKLNRVQLPTSPPSQRLIRFVGIYSGRTSETSFLGIVWKPTVVLDILREKVPTA